MLRNFGLECRFAPDNDPQHMESLIDPRTRAIYVETIGNPSFAVPDFGALAALARRYDLPLIVDNTFGAGGYLVPSDRVRRCRRRRVGDQVARRTRHVDGRRDRRGRNLRLEQR